MRLPAFDHTDARWDEFKAFHVRHRARDAIVQFDTGELIITSGYFKPHQRRAYQTFGLTILAGHDTPQLPDMVTPTGEPVRRSWLATPQTLLIDESTRRVVRLLRYGQLKGIPVRLRGHARGYFAGPGEPPLGGSVSVKRPIRLTPEQRRHLADVHAACTMWAAFQSEQEQRGILAAANIQPWPLVWQRPVETARIINQTFADILPAMRLRVAAKGLKTTYTIETHDYLLLK
jgi:hypothetical protein